MANNEYIFTVKRNDNRVQHFQAVTMDSITYEFPFINLEAAT